MHYLFLMLAAASIQDGLRDWMTSGSPLIARTTISVAEGAPSNSISALAYGAGGSLMVGSSAGLARYDGAIFERLLAQETPGLDGDRVLSLLTDSQERTWVGSFRVGPSILEDGAFRKICDSEVLASVVQFFEAADGSIWIVGDRIGVHRAGTLMVMGASQGLPPARYERIVEDSAGELWIASDQGVFRGGAEGFQQVDDLPSEWIMLGFDGSVWASREDGTLTSLTLDPPEVMNTGRLWITDELTRAPGYRLLCTGQGVITMRRTEEPGPGFELLRIQVPARDSGRVRTLNCLLNGPAGGIWGGTETHGLDFLQRRYVKMYSLDGEIAPGVPGAAVHRVVALPGGGLLAHSNGFGSLWRLGVDGTKHPVKLPDPTYQAPNGAVLQGGAVWVSADGGLARLEGDTLVAEERWVGKSGPIAALADGSVWFDFGGQVRCAVQGRYEDSPPVGFAISPSTESADGTMSVTGGKLDVRALGSMGGALVAATPGQLLRFDSPRGRWELLADLGRANIRMFREGPDGELWVSTYGDGLYRVQLNGRVHHWSTSAGLPDAFLGWIAPLEDDRQLWLNSNMGVIRVSVDSLDAYAQGALESIEFSAYPAPEGNGATGAQMTANILALPTIEGLAMFDRSAVPPPDVAPTITLKEPLAGGVPLSSAKDLVGQVDIQFEFEAPVFPTVEGSRFQYRLPGVEDRWVNVAWGESVRFLGLRAGEYRFEMRGRKATSPWSEPVSAASIEILPAWHERTLNRVLLLATLAVLGWGYLGLRVVQFRRRNAALRNEIEQRTLAETELRASEERFRHMFHSAPSAIVACSPKGEVLDRNGRADALFGWTNGPPASWKPWRAFDKREVGREVFRKVAETGAPSSTVAMTCAADDHLKRCQWHLAATFDAEDKVLAVIALVIDLSRRDADAKNVRALRSSIANVEEKERGRIARELHDDLSQRLAALSLGAHFLSESVVHESPEVRSTIEAFRSELGDIATDVHSISRQLHPKIVDDLGLQRALRSECSSRDRLTEAVVSLEVSGDVEDPPRDTALTLFRVAQEATRNAIKHSGASKIVVGLQVCEEELELYVIDNGRGFRVQDNEGREGLGLRSMQERVTLAGGELKVESDPGLGTRVVARVSVDSRA